MSTSNNEIKKTDSKKVLFILMLISTVFILASLLMNILFAKDRVESMGGTIVWDFEFILAIVEMVAILGLVIVLALALFDIKTMKFLFIPTFLAAASSTTSVSMIIISVVKEQVSFDASLALFFLVFVTLIFAYVCLGIYSLKKSIAISFAAIFATLSLAISLGFNINRIIFITQQVSGFEYMLPYLIMICMNVGLGLLIWSFCAIMPPETKDKDIIKKNIALYVILSIITLGVFAVFWVRAISNDIAKLEGEKVNSCLQAAMFFVVPLYAIYWLYTKGKKTAKLANDADMSVLFAVHGLFCLCFFSLALMQHQLHLATGLSEAKK